LPIWPSVSAARTRRCTPSPCLNVSPIIP
jgi:hypothetical protein